MTVVSVGDTPEQAIAALERLRGPVSVVRRCPELTGLLAACQSGLARVAVVAESADELTATLVDRLTAVGVSVVAVAGSADEAVRLRGIGAIALTGRVSAESLSDAVLAAVHARKFPGTSGFGTVAPAAEAMPHADDAGTGSGATAADAGDDARGVAAAAGPGTRDDDGTAKSERGGPAPKPQANPAELPGRTHHGAKASVENRGTAGARAVATLTRLIPHRNSGPSATQQRGPFSRQRQGKATGSAGANSAAGERPAPQTVAVWGPVGSPGRTLLAVNLAAEYAVQGRSVMVIDADSYGASVAATLGLLDEAASFAQACRIADQGTLSRAELARVATEVVFSAGTFTLLTGLTRPDRWPELRAAAVERVLRTAASLADVVVIDCGFSLESDEELSYDTVAPRRNAATLSALAAADVIYAVGSADAIGIPRLVRALAELPEACVGTDVRIVLNKVRRKAVGGSPAKGLKEAWERFGPEAPISHFLPWDPDLADKALLEGRLLLEIAPDAPLRKAVRELLCAPVQ
ncbi:AAA family ATPase [Arthrobacter sp. ERGS1:01]|uniref:AAA family ATPase n=1 Tax=Arthrobacter sp. ERGS1:01 TaxID=1704044 RepID=UPI00307C5FE4